MATDFGVKELLKTHIYPFRTGILKSSILYPFPLILKSTYSGFLLWILLIPSPPGYGLAGLPPWACPSIIQRNEYKRL